MRAFARDVTGPGRVYLVGGASALLEGWRRSTVDVDLRLDPEPRGAFEAMVQGKLNCTVECNPLIGPQLFDAVEAILAGQSLPKRVVTEEGVFEASTAAEVLPTRQY